MDTENGEAYIKVCRYSCWCCICSSRYFLLARQSRARTEMLTFSDKHLAYFVRTHEKALANALQIRRQASRTGISAVTSNDPGGATTSPTSTTYNTNAAPASTSSTLAAALSLPSLNFAAHHLKPAKLTLTAHHLFFLLSRFAELGIPVGPMDVRLETLHAESSNYVSFLSQSQRLKGRASDRDSIHSVSSVRSVMSGMSSLWSNFGISSSNAAAKSEKAKLATEADLKYLYASFTKIPCLRLSPDRKSRLIEGYEEFPFDSAVPLLAFKNISALEVCDIDIRQFFGWDRMADQLRSLTVKRAGVEDPTDLLINIVLDDMDKRRRRSSKTQVSPVITWAEPKASTQPAEAARSNSAPGSPEPLSGGQSGSPKAISMVRGGSEGSKVPPRPRTRSISPSRSNVSRMSSHHRSKSHTQRTRRSGSNSSQSSSQSLSVPGSSSSNLLLNQLPANKWRFLRHLSLSDNSLTTISVACLYPLADTLHSLDLSSNLFSQVPDSLASLTALRALNLSGCMIESLHSLTRNPLPAITALNLRDNRLTSIAGVERLPSLERLDLRSNRLTDPTEMARLTSTPDIREIWVSGNPFTRSYSGYRVTIFNLFRNAPGYSEDIIIDSSGPGYSERRQLLDRVPEPALVPVIKAPAQEYKLPEPVTNTNKPLPKSPFDDGLYNSDHPDRPTIQSSHSDVPATSHRRRKPPKRRIVELSRTEESAGAVRPLDSPSLIPESLQQQSYLQRTNSLPVQPPRLDTTMAPPPLPPSLTPSTPAQDWTASSEIYKRKIEALRNEVGNGWLSVLSEEGWNGKGDPQKPVLHHSTGSIADREPVSALSPASTISTIRPSPTTPRATSAAAGRTLG